MKNIFVIYKQIFPLNAIPYVIVETNFTSDGLRSRLCDGRYGTEKAALEAKLIKEEKEEASNAPNNI